MSSRSIKLRLCNDLLESRVTLCKTRFHASLSLDVRHGALTTYAAIVFSKMLFSQSAKLANCADVVLSTSATLDNRGLCIHLNAKTSILRFIHVKHFFLAGSHAFCYFVFECLLLKAAHDRSSSSAPCYKSLISSKTCDVAMHSYSRNWPIIVIPCAHVARCRVLFL